MSTSLQWSGYGRRKSRSPVRDVLNQLTEAGQLPRAPIFVDSPLSVNATEVYRLHPECFNESIYKFLREKSNPFGMENLTYIRELAHSMKLNELKDPAIIISASGMCEAGRIRHHLKNHIGQTQNLVLFIGYCAEHTLGAQILAGQNPVNIFGEPSSEGLGVGSGSHCVVEKPRKLPMNLSSVAQVSNLL